MKLGRLVVRPVLAAAVLTLVAPCLRSHAQAPAAQAVPGVSQPTTSSPTTSATARRTPATTPAAKSFDAISIKVDQSGSGRHSLSNNIGGGRLRAVNVPLSTFIQAAYQIPTNRIVGAPDWFDTEYFDIDATSINGSSNEDNYDRMRSMLGDRFKLAMHQETRNLPVYALVLVQPGKLGSQSRTTDDNCGNFQKTDLAKPNAASDEKSTPDDVNCGDASGATGNKRVRYVAHSVSMEKLLQILAGPPSRPYVERPIVDQTGLTSKLDFVLEFTPPQAATAGDQAANDPSVPPSFETALREQLGLRLQPTTAPVDVLVIDHVEQPSSN